ncbi:MAG: hypothetical protein OEU26_29220, partial [Candidatus Tectomicrobia bacterium]|nr:hypothetical protein [Candidatus Tectomicrobia bacterium]
MPSMSLTQRLARKTQRLAKISRQRWSRMSQAANASTRAIFVFGAQRSGSRLPIQVMERSPDILTYSEGHSRAFNGVLLKQRETLVHLLDQSPFPVVAFKPICESHRAVELLDTFPGARALWIFRHF